MPSKHDTINEIISRIKRLRVQEELALASLEIEIAHLKASEELLRNQNPESAAHPPATSPVRSTPSPTTTAHSGEAYTYKEGDIIVIKNKVARPLGRPVNKGDRIGVVTAVTPIRVYFRTNNGTNTWRAPGNLRLKKHHE
jgi:sulfur carrier protein ThiS